MNGVFAALSPEKWGEWIAIAALLGLLYFPLRTYTRAARGMTGNRGKVAGPYDAADLPVALVLMGWLGLAAWQGIARAAKAPREVTEEALAQNVLLFAVLVAGIFFFLWARKIRVWSAFGLGVVRPGRAVWLGAGFLLAAYPVILLANLAMVRWLGGSAQPQEIIEFFSDAVKEENRWRILGVALMAAVAAPLGEEILFRGYFYGVLKRFIGPWGGMVVVSGLFAAIHGNLMAAPALFLLAICFTLAYERTGSLLVPMAMHAFFNSLTLLLIYLTSRLADGPPQLW